MKKLFTLFLALVASVGIASAQSGTCGYNLTWTLSNGTLTISGTGAMKDYYSYSRSPWYDYRSSIKSVIINDGVTSIGVCAFDGCSSLTSVTIPNSVTRIEDYAFSDCSKLTSITIPNSVTRIGYSFYGCKSLTSINVDSNNPNYSSVDGVLFNKEKTTLVAYPGGKQGAYTIPNSVTSIGYTAFHGCSSLTSVTIPNSVTSIGESAFYGCDKLVDVYCYATTPPVTKGENTFSYYNAFLYVPCESKKAYMVDAVWGNFKYIECISSEGIEDVQSDEVQSAKVVKDGQVLILRNGKTYTMQGQEVK